MDDQPLEASHPRATARSNRPAIFLLLFLVTSFSVSIVYVNVRTYDPVLTPKSGYTDTVDYVRMYQGLPGSGLRAYRPLVPFLARVAPSPPKGLFDVGGHLDDHIAMKFGVVNFVFLVGSCLALCLLMTALGFGFLEATLGVLLLLSTPTIVRSAGLPMVDTAFLFFFTVALVAIVRRNWWMLLAATAMGVMAKELVLLAAPMALLSESPWRIRIRLLMATLPAFVLYGVIRMMSSVPADDDATAALLGNAGAQLRHLASVSGLTDLALAFGLMWFPAVYALASGNASTLLRRWAYLVPLVLVGVVLGHGNFVRSTVSACPVVVVLAVVGLRSWISALSFKPSEQL